MDISRYRSTHDLSRGDFGKLIDVSGEFIRLCEVGKRKLSPERAIRLEQVTGGEISKSDTRPDLWPAIAEQPA